MIKWTFFFSLLFAFSTAFYPIRSNPGPPAVNFVIDTLCSGLTVPWDITFLPNGDMLFTERPGRVRLYHNNHLQAASVLMLDSVEATRKMGLLGMCLHPLFVTNHYIYLAYNYRSAEQTFLRISRYEYISNKLVNPKIIIDHIPGSVNHNGSRLKFGPDKKLYISTGDADMPILAQDLKAYNGKILRLNEDGSIPADNPFVHNDTALHEIWTYGHRNTQGIAFQPLTNFLYNSEHGPTGGDEINLINAGNNYGWPVIHHRDLKDGMMTPVMEFTPSIGPAEALFYSGKAFPSLKEHLLVACMRGEAILNIRFNNNKISSYNFLLKNHYGRIRALAEGPDGSLYFATTMVDPNEGMEQAKENSYDFIFKMRPAKPGENTLATLDTMNYKMTTALFSKSTISNAGIKSLASSKDLYIQLCAGCHGMNMEGKEHVPSLVDKTWINGGTKPAIVKSITRGIVAKGMPAWEGALSSAEVGKMADYILSKKSK